MQKPKAIKKYIIVSGIGMLLLIGIAVFCYQRVKNAIIVNEQMSLKSLAKVNAQSMQSSLEAKRNLIFALFSEDMDTIEAVDKALLKLGEKGMYYEKAAIDLEKAWVQELCNEAWQNPWNVVAGSVRLEENAYELCLAKAVSMQGRITGCVVVEINLEHFYVKEQGLASLEVENNRFCIIKTADGTTIMPNNYAEENISLTHETENGCTIAWIYETNGGTPDRVRKLIAYEGLVLGEEEFFLYIIEDYDKLIQPIEEIAFYFCIIGIVLFLSMAGFMYSFYEQQKKEVILEKELLHEKTLNETMKKQEGLMQKYNHSKTMGVLTGSIAHEFNNLMTPIVLYSDLLEENEVIQKEMPEEIAELKSAASRCEELARQLLSYSRQGKVEKVLTDYDASYAVKDAVNMVGKLLPANIELKANICKTSYFIHGQVGTMNQILLNLTTNAIHAMRDGGVLKISFGLSTDAENYVRLIVEDNGSGISEEIRQKVFHPFFTTKQTGEGTGIGLTVVKRLTEEHGGYIRVQSVEGEGTMFILDFPCVKDIQDSQAGVVRDLRQLS